ncbi:hypothetical protein U9R90_28520 [Streptomyces sp. E11-3]|uniref:hypothetical protein n=1 Tax=Streptomyces sp. E11-3 TaxID=3110112 RepID=UPI003981925A
MLGGDPAAAGQLAEAWDEQGQDDDGDVVSGGFIPLQQGRLERLACLYVDPAQLMVAPGLRPDPRQKDVLRGFPNGGRSGTLVCGRGSVKRLMLTAS